MVTSSVLEMTDIGRRKRFSTDLSGELTPGHNVEQAVDHYLSQVGLPRKDHRWVAVSRGLRLDQKKQLADLPEADNRWKVLPESTAGGS